jgi:hypothetical protein
VGPLIVTIAWPSGLTIPETLLATADSQNPGKEQMLAGGVLTSE